MHGIKVGLGLKMSVFGRNLWKNFVIGLGTSVESENLRERNSSWRK